MADFPYFLFAARRRCAPGCATVNRVFLDPAPMRAWQVLGEVDRFYQINARPKDGAN